MKTLDKIGSQPASPKRSLGLQKGSTLIETMVAAVILVIGVLTLAGTLASAANDNWNRGDRATRTTEYAEDKMEQLMALSFTDTASNTAVYPPTTTGGTGLTAGGGVTSGSPISGYVDYVNDAGAQQTSATGATYVRQWSVSVNAAANLETITVMVSALDTYGLGGATPTVTLVCTKSAIQ